MGGDLSGTAVAVAERAGADDLLVVDGRFPVEGARAVSAELGTALDTLRASTARLDDADSPYLLDEVREGSDEVGERIADATNSIEVAAEATRLVAGPARRRRRAALDGGRAHARASSAGPAAWPVTTPSCAPPTV